MSGRVQHRDIFGQPVRTRVFSRTEIREAWVRFGDRYDRASCVTFPDVTEEQALELSARFVRRFAVLECTTWGLYAGRSDLGVWRAYCRQAGSGTSELEADIVRMAYTVLGLDKSTEPPLFADDVDD